MPTPAAYDSRYATIVRSLAGRALGMAVDASAFRPREGEARESMLVARPAARLLAGETGDGLQAGLAAALGRVASLRSDTAFVDGAGHRREVYGPLVAHLCFSAAALSRPPAGPGGVEDLRGLVVALLAALADEHRVDAAVSWDTGEEAGRVAGALWRALVTLQGALLTGDIDSGLSALGVIGRVADTPGPGGALHAQTADDTPDAWVYRELTGLHALYLASQVTRDAGWAVRCRQVAAYHVEHTQPDYTTYQPWALAAFAEDASTAGFAEQQLHDVQTHLAIEGPGGALLPGLLLGDAAASLDGRMVGGWSRLRFQG